ncbi:MAG: hypothetical protein AAFX94_01030 [Myxococcota bacterium]
MTLPRLATYAASSVILLAASTAAAQSGGLSETAPDRASTLYSSEAWPGGTSNRGTLGINALELAAPLPAGDWVLNLAATYSVADDLFGDGGENERTRQFFNVTWAPIESLELSIRQSTVSNRNDAADIETTQSLGDPAFAAKYSTLITPEFGLGGLVSFLVPTSAGGTGLNPEAFVLDANLLASYFLSPYLQATLNVGYRLDNSRDIFKRDDELLSPSQRFTANVSELDMITYGIGAEAQFRVGSNFYIDPYLELTGGLPLSAGDSTEAPLLASLGAKLLPFGKTTAEFNLGGDFRLAGAPDPALNELPGLPPWELFLRFAFHLNPPEAARPVEVVSQSGSCELNSDCPSGTTCGPENVCVQEVEKTVVVEKAPDTFSLSGGVFDKKSGEPVGQAVIKIPGEPMYAVDYKTGAFGPVELMTGDGLVQVVVEAPGYRLATQQVQKGKKDETLALKFELESLGKEAVGEIRGSLKDARSGRPLRGQIFIPVLNRKIRVDKSGRFAARVKANRYQVLITSKGYVTQKKDIEIRAGDVVILNVDLAKGR